MSGSQLLYVANMITPQKALSKYTTENPTAKYTADLKQRKRLAKYSDHHVLFSKFSKSVILKFYFHVKEMEV